MAGQRLEIRYNCTFQSEVFINPLFTKNALIDFDQGTFDGLIEQRGKWPELGRFLLKV